MAHLFVSLLLIEELEQEERRRASYRLRRAIRNAQDPFTLPDAQFLGEFGLHKNACRYLIEKLEPHMDTSRTFPTSVKILAALHFFATGTSKTSLENSPLSFLSQSRVDKCIKEVTVIVIKQLMNVWIHFPKNAAEKRRLKLRFQCLHRMPHIVGVVDGTHVAIEPPEENERIYINKRGYHSINCQIICDGHLRIISAVVKWPGKTRDAYIWCESRAGQAMRENFRSGDQDSRILGDVEFDCLPWLMVPIDNPTTPQQINFNNRLRRCQNTVKQCIGLLKGRFHCLLKNHTLHFSPVESARIVLCCAVLHNIALNFRVENPEPKWDEIDLDPPVPSNTQLLDAVGQQRRKDYIEAFF